MSEAPVEAKPRFKVLRVLAVAVPAVLLVLLGFVYLTFFGGIEQINAWTAPPVIKVSGQVLWNGKPVPNARIATVPHRSSLTGALGFADEEGRFVLTTDVNGKLVDGAYAGKHKVTVAGHRPAQGPLPPALLTPQAYSSFDSTPLEITVSRDPADNEGLKIALEGEAPAPGNTAGAPLMLGGGGGGPPPGVIIPGREDKAGDTVRPVPPPPPVMPEDLEKQQDQATDENADPSTSESEDATDESSAAEATESESEAE